MAKDPKNLAGLLRSVLPESVTVLDSSTFGANQGKLSTGLVSLDGALGGGYPKGTIVQLHGPPGSGKDMLINLAIAGIQREKGSEAAVLWTSFGYEADIPYMRLCGCQLQDKDVPGSETVGDILFLRLEDCADSEKNPAELLLESLLKALKTGAFDLIVLNEMGSGETKDDTKKGLEQEVKMATWSKLVTEFCKKYFTIMRVPKEDGTLIDTVAIVVNPARANVSATGPYAPTTVQTSGYALAHAKTVDVHLKAGAPTYSTVGGNKVLSKKEFTWKIKKAKHGVSEGSEGSFFFSPNTGVDIFTDAVDFAISIGVIDKKGSRYRMPVRKGDYEVIGLDEAHKFYNDPEKTDPDEFGILLNLIHLKMKERGQQ
jgi:RecA/RadA recombinase